MKQILTLLALICGYLLCGAQATSLTVDNQMPGWLSSKINYGDQQTVENLTITGYVNGADIEFIGSLMEKHCLKGHLDMTNVDIVDTEYANSPTSIGELHMFNLSKWVKIRRLSIPLSLQSVSPYLLAYVQADTIDYGSSHCNILTPLLSDNAYVATNSAPKVLIIRDGVEKIEKFYQSNGITKHKLLTVILPQSINSIEKNAFKGCKNLMSINFPNTIHTIGEYAFAETNILPDTLKLPESLKMFYVNSFPVKDGQTVIVGENVERIDNTDSELTSNSTLTFVINRVMPPRFVKKYSPDGIDLECCTLHVPKAGYAMYKDPNYNSLGYSGINPYSFATIKVIPIKVKGISLNHTAESLNVGSKLNLVATITPYDADNLNVTWSSSNTNTANVTDNGIVTAISSGTAVIKAQSKENPNIYATCEIIVHQPLESISLSISNIRLNVGELYSTLKVTFVPSTADNKKVSFYSSDSTIVSVDENGVIKGVSNGTAQIIVMSAENPEIKAECTVTVIQPVSGVTLNKTTFELVEDESEQLVATVLPENASNRGVNWTSSDVSVAMVSPDGTVFGIKAGEATIMATTVDGGFVALCKVTIKAKAVLVSNIELSAKSETMAVGETFELNAMISPNNASNKMVNWTSTDSQIATVNDSGLVTALTEGKTQIIATTADGSNLSAICEITVKKQFNKISQIKISPSNAILAVGQSLSLSAVITPNNATNKVISWSSTNPAVATVSETGVVTAVSQGDAIIIASTQDGSNLSATCQISVYTEAILVESIDLSPSKIEGDVNETYQINATVLPVNATNKTIAWSSSDDSVASVEDGFVKLNAIGTAIITAEALDGSNVKSECTIVVSHETGIAAIITDKDTYVKIYNLSGELIYEGVYSDAKLNTGFYIVIYNGSSFKVQID